MQVSTVELTKEKEIKEFYSAVKKAYKHDYEVMVEQFIPGRELTVPILADEPLPVGEIIIESEIFDYETKYQSGKAQEIFPADLPGNVVVQAQAFALTTHRALKLRGYSRVDFRLDADNKLWCLEANTLPGMTAASLF